MIQRSSLAQPQESVSSPVIQSLQSLKRGNPRPLEIVQSVPTTLNDLVIVTMRTETETLIHKLPCAGK